MLAALAWGLPLCVQGSSAPAYTAATIVNSATSTPDGLAPNTIASIYGTNLSNSDPVAASGLRPGTILVQELAGVRVYVGGRPVCLYYVSSQQINFLVPADLRPGEMDLFVAREGVAGPQAHITLHDVGPGLFQSSPNVLIATHANGILITKNLPAHAGETVVAYATGLGPTTPPVVSGMVSMAPAQIAQLSDFQVLVNGAALPRASILYAGVSPGPPGLYQVTFILPKSVTPNPEIRVAIGDQSSPPGVKLFLQ